MIKLSAFTAGTWRHTGKKTTLVLGYLDSSNAEGLRRAMSIVTDKIPEVFEQQNINNSHNSSEL